MCNSVHNMSKKVKCQSNTVKSVCLEDILKSFNSGIKEEHAWALCYQCVKYFIDSLASNRPECCVVTEVNHILLQSDGNIDPNTLFPNDSDRKPLTCKEELITGLGCVIYSALDRGSHNGEERAISQDLEQLITDMISDERNTSDERHHETDDEGIERDSEDAENDPTCSFQQSRISLEEILRRCERHLGNLTKSQVETHYRAVVRALVAEALELATFLEKVAQGTSSLRLSGNGAANSDLDQLQFADWARFWVQVISELRMGVKLKKVHYSKAPIEYELTPYEILMKDIRSCRYNLRKIMINGNITSRVTKDAHAIILEFIRSRPPLKKASDRKLAPYSRTLTPREQLMNSIKKGRALKPATHRARASLSPSIEHKPRPSQGETSERRLIKVDFSQLEDDDDEEDGSFTTSPCSEAPGLWPQEEYHQLYESALAAYDLATDSHSSYKRNTLRVYPFELGTQSVPQSRPCSRQSCTSSEAESVQLEPEVAKALQDELTHTRPWHETMSIDDRLSLTLEEIVHIRSVLTKAELEALPVEGHIKTDVENRKVCFLCLKTRFGIFGPWGHRCTLCKRTVCTKCFSRMNLPMEYFSSVPVVLLSPSIMSTPDEDRFPRALVTRIVDSEGSDSPGGSRPGSSAEGEREPPSALHRFRSRASAVGRAAGVVDKLKAEQMVVCQDCKMMVLQIIKTARVSRSEIRNKTLQNLTLNLSPVF